MIKLGQRLRTLRLEKGLTLEDVVTATKIRSSFLTAIEKGEYNKLPSSSYAQGFVANYAEYLGLPKKEALALFRREFDEKKVFTVLPKGFTESKTSTFPRIAFHRRTILVAVAFLLLLSYLGFAYKDAFLNPPLTITSPQTNKVSTGNITIAGKTNPYATLTINNTPVTLREDGTFSRRVSLFSGRATITIRAANRFGRTTTVTKIIDVEE